MADTSLKRYLDTLPKVYKAQTNRVLSALLKAIATADDTIAQQIQVGKDQLFVRTATGQSLDRLANSLGVSRPATLGLTDEEFQELIPNLSLKPKQVKKAFYDTADVFWGPLFSRANITAVNAAPYDLSPGDEIDVKIDAGETQTIIILSSEIATPGAATIEEVVAILNRIEGATATTLTDSLTGDQFVNLRTDTPGSVGSIEILGSSTAISSTKLDLPVGLFDILDLDQRVSVYNIDPNELIIEIPAIVPTLRRTLRGSHHFHEDGTLKAPEPPEDGIWAGSFFFNPNASGGAFTVTSQTATLQQTINKGDVLTSLTVDDTSLIENPSGNLMINFGGNTQEVPIRYRGVPNTNTILIDPSYIFEENHAIGEVINIISAEEPYIPVRDGTDLPIFFTSPAGAREVVQEILLTLRAAGIVITFVILAPDYRYLIDNPYLNTDNAPGS